jgi:hypothetical protein
MPAAGRRRISRGLMAEKDADPLKYSRMNIFAGKNPLSSGFFPRIA